LKRFSLTGTERIKSKKIFELVYAGEKSIFSPDKKIKAFYYALPGEGKEIPVKIAAAVSKRAGKSVWRNRVKRLIRDAYRLNKHQILEHCIRKKINLYIVFSPNHLNEKNMKKIYLKDLLPGIADVLTIIKRKI